MKEDEEVDTEATIEEDQEITDEVIEESQETVEEYDIEEDVDAPLVVKNSLRNSKRKQEQSLACSWSKSQRNPRGFLRLQYAARITEATEELKGSLQERVDSYLEYVAQEWMVENELAVEQGLKTEMTESFLSGMKGLFEEHYVTIPEDKYDVLENMVDKLDEMETISMRADQ